MNATITTALEQLTGSKNPVRMLQVLIGAKSNVHGENNVYIKHMSSKGELRRAAAVTQVVYDVPSDTYTIKFSTTRGNLIAEFNGVYNDQLKSLFERQTGLYLSLR